MKKFLYVLTACLLVSAVSFAQASKRGNNKKAAESGTNSNTNTNTNSNTNDGVTTTTQEETESTGTAESTEMTESSGSGEAHGHWVAAKHNLEAAKRHLTQAGADASVISSIDAALTQVNDKASQVKMQRKDKRKDKHGHHGHGHGHDHNH